MAENPRTDPAKRPTLKERLRKAFGWVNGPGRAMWFVVLAVVLVLFGRDVLQSIRVEAEIRELRNRKQAFEESIAADSALLKKLDDPEFLERYARENYLMRRAGEEVYIVKEK